MRYFPRTALIALLVAALAATGIGSSIGPAAAAAPNPTIDETARLLGYMWGDGAETNGVWDVNGPSGTSSLIEELVEAHGGSWQNRSKLIFTLPAPYDWNDWKDGLPDDSSRVRNAVKNQNFLSAVMETEASVEGQIYDQSACCVPGYTVGRLTELKNLMRDSGYSTAKFVKFNNADSGRITIAASEFAELRAASTFACPTEQAAIRIPGGSNLNAYGNLQWIQAGDTWGDVVRSDCPVGQSVPDPTTQPGSCTVRANGNEVIVDWTFTLGDAVIRRDGKYVTTLSGRDGTWSQNRADGNYTYQVRLIAFGIKTTVNCGSVTVPGNGGPPPPADGPCVVAAQGNQVLVSWDDFGKNRYSVRRNNSWAGSVVDGSRSLLLSGSVNDSWSLRYANGDQRVDVACTAGVAPPPDGPCVVTALANGVRLTWDVVPGGNSYVVRRNNGWLATVRNGGTSYDDPFGSAGDTYELRVRRDGVVTDTSCA